MKLTDKSRWHYSFAPSLKHIYDVLARDAWVGTVARILPDTKLDYIELGCAPGLFTAAIVKDKPWSVTGIDYSPDTKLFAKVIDLVGKDAIVYQEDLFEFGPPGKYDVVASYGLVEHFRGKSFEEVMSLHDIYAKANGYIVIAVPNFTGFPYVFHYIFDRPDLDRHNIDIMQPGTISGWLRDKGYEVIFDDYVGVLRLWGNSGFTYNKILAKLVAAFAVILSRLVNLLSAFGIRLTGRSWSPYLLVIAQKPESISSN
jgi:hypothetical protein